MNEQLLRLAKSGSGCGDAVIRCRVRHVIMVVVVIRISFVMLRVDCIAVFMRFEHHVHVRIKKKNEIAHQRERTAEAQPDRVVCSRSHSEPVPPDPRPSSGVASMAQA